MMCCVRILQAIVAEQAGVEQFSVNAHTGHLPLLAMPGTFLSAAAAVQVGMELIEVSKQESHMRSLCSTVRARYTGRLTCEQTPLPRAQCPGMRLTDCVRFQTAPTTVLRIAIYMLTFL